MCLRRTDFFLKQFKLLQLFNTKKINILQLSPELATYGACYSSEFSSLSRLDFKTSVMDPSSFG